MHRYRSGLYTAMVGALLLAIWILAISVMRIPSYILPSPRAIFAAAIDQRSVLEGATLITLRGAVLGFIASVCVGLVVSVVLGSAPVLRTSLYPYVVLLQMVPVSILAPLFVIWLGDGLPSIVAITFMIGFFPIVANTTMGLISVDPNLRELFQMCDATKTQEMLYLRMPTALPHFLTGMRISGTLAPIGAIVGDFIAGRSQGGAVGIGFLTNVYFSQLKTPELFAAALVSCALGFLFIGSVSYLHWLLLHQWHESLVRKE